MRFPAREGGDIIKFFLKVGGKLNAVIQAPLFSISLIREPISFHAYMPQREQSLEVWAGGRFYLTLLMPFRNVANRHGDLEM